jgi:nonribosomal peptide synthetase DhbF
MANSGVLVTGANGFFGLHLLQELKQLGVAPLKAMVRAETVDGAWQRLKLAEQQYQLALERGDLEVVPCDLSRPGCGLSEQSRDHFLEGIDTLVHAGACVNFTASPEQLMRTNAGGTTQLLELARTAGIRRFLQVSSLAVCNGLNLSDQHPVPEAPLNDQPKAGLSSYGQSKLAAEQSCYRFVAKGLEVSVLRLPYLLASESSFALNPHGYLDVVLRATLSIGASFDDAFSLHALPVDLCARWVARMALTPEVPLVVHVVSDPPVQWRDWIDAASALGEPLRLEPMEQWYGRLRKAVAASRSPYLMAAIAFLSLENSHKRWMHVNAHRLSFANHKLCTLVPEAAIPLELSVDYRQTVLRQLAT